MRHAAIFTLVFASAFASPRAQAAIDYHSPNLTENPFEGSLLLTVSQRKVAASELVTLIRAHLLTGEYPAHRVPRVLGIALLLDADNADAKSLDAALRQTGDVPAKGGPPTPAVHQPLLVLAASEQKSSADADKRLAAYLFAAVQYAFPRDAVAKRGIAELKEAGYVADWSKIDPIVATTAPATRPTRPAGSPAPPAARPTPPVATPAKPALLPPAPEATEPPIATPATRPAVTEIRGLVVIQTDDNQYHGQALDIIATNEPAEIDGAQFGIRDDVGQEMLIAFNEAERLVKILHPQLKNVRMNISFGDKYSEKDGGSAGTAFALVMLAGLGDFQIDPDVAITGDITVDSKVRAVGEVPAKVHGAALDHCTRVAIPESNVADMDDAYLIQGPSAFWEINIFSVRTLDDAIAVVRSNPDAKLAEAIRLFDKLRTDYGGRPIGDLAKAKDVLQRIVDLAPNCVSAQMLLRGIDGKAPAHLSTIGTLKQAILDCGPMQTMIAGDNPAARNAGDSDYNKAKADLKSLESLADPAAANVITSAEAYCDAYHTWAVAIGDHHSTAAANKSKSQRNALQQACDAVKDAVKRVAVDPAVIDRLLHNS